MAGTRNCTTARADAQAPPELRGAGLDRLLDDDLCAEHYWCRRRLREVGDLDATQRGAYLGGFANGWHAAIRALLAKAPGGVILLQDPPPEILSDEERFMRLVGAEEPA